MSNQTKDAPVTLADLIDQLVPPAEPPAISMVPQTAGWAVLGAAVLVALAYGGWRWLAHRRENAYRRHGLAALADAGNDPGRIAEALRRTALSGFPRTEVASLSGDDWLRFLDRTGGFPAEPGRLVTQSPYRAPVDAPPPDVTALREAAANWIKHHRREGVA
ncbi:DUF4381 domain-containing protein [Shimia biformata]|uniref:DUF4381 domain-containing protein n=1 Tax=Shimia biformata TaxID=1294299 RepID=UPI0019528FFF|nr:DUF4381 domain-containing protein [Shimia biformata]